MPACAVAKCTNYHRKTKGSDVHYHRFPKDKNIIKQWLVKCKRRDVNVANAAVCNRHFTEDDYVRDLKAELLGLPPAIRLKPTAIPSLCLDGVSQNPEGSVDNGGGSSMETASSANKQTAVTKKARSDRYEARDIKKRALLRFASIVIEKTRDEETQTEPITMLTDKEMEQHKTDISRQKFVSYRLIKEVLKLKERNAKMAAERKKEKKDFKIKVEEQVKQMVGKVFTDNQMRYLQKRRKRMIWDQTDITRALAISAISKKCYNYLRNQLNMPLPGLTTLKRCVAYTSSSGNVTLPSCEGITMDDEKSKSTNTTTLKGFLVKNTICEDMDDAGDDDNDDDDDDISETSESSSQKEEVL